MAENTSELIDRNSIDDKYKWNLKDIYENEQLWNNDFNYIDANITRYKTFQNKLTGSEEKLLECLKFDEELSIKYDRLHLYTFLSKDLDLTNPVYQEMSGKLEALGTKLSHASSFIKTEIVEIDDNILKGWMQSNSELADYSHFFDNMFRNKKYILSKNEEELMSLASEISSTAYQAFGYLKNADIEYPTVEDSEGKPFKISDGRYLSALYSTDRAFRERVYKNYYKPVIQFKTTLSSLFNSSVKSYNFFAKARKYDSTRAMALNANNIPLTVYDNLINSVNNNLAPMHRWAELRKKILKLDELHPFDSYVTLFSESKRVYSYDEGVEIVRNSLIPLGEEYIAALDTAFNNRWIDVYETKAKRSGAYSSGTSWGCHPYVLLNWNGELNDVFTLAHEMGHNMHSFFTEKSQPYVYADYPIFLAEVASTANEALLTEYLIKNATSKEEKLSLLENYINKIVTTFYRQTAFAEYEMITHAKIEEGTFLSSDELCSLYKEIYQKQWGPAMVVDEEETYTWARVPHFYYGFYVFQYATGIAASEVLAQNIVNNPQKGVDKLMGFLRAGKSDYAINILKNADVDMTSPDPVLSVINKMNSLIDEVEALIAMQ